MVRHTSLGEGVFFAAPGGGMEYSENAADCLAREFQEETGLRIEVQDFLFVHEFNAPPLHAVELFFRVKPSGGSLHTGIDPELDEKEQIIEHVAYMSPGQISRLPEGQLHHALRLKNTPRELLNVRGYFKYEHKRLK